MGLIEDVKRMQAENRPDAEITRILEQRGVSDREINAALAQSRIKEAVSGSDYPPTPTPQGTSSKAPQEYEGMQASMLAPESQPEEYPVAPESRQEYGQTDPTQPYQEYQQYQPSGISSDTITEIAEQVVDEKISQIRDSLKKTLDLKNTLEGKMEYLDERLKRMEKIIDRLQLSVLQKVGEYVTNVDDIKKELIETQKSFKSLLPEAKHPKKDSN